MRNYLKAEWYKVLRRSYLWVTAGVVLAGELFLLLDFVFLRSAGVGTSFATGWTNLVALLPLGLCASLLTGDMVMAGQHRNGTLKNEVAFGLSRAKIYWGKLLAQTELSLLLCLAFLGFYLAGCWLLLAHDPAADRQALQDVGRALASALPLWLGVQGLCCCMYFLCPSDLTGGITALVILFGLPVVYLIFGGLGGGTPLGLLIDRLYDLTPLVLLNRVINTSAPWDLCARCWAVGAAWFGGFTALGLLAFRRKEL